MPNIFHNSLSLGYPIAGPSYPTDGLIERWNFSDTLTGLNGNTWTMTTANYSYEVDSSIGSGKAIKISNNDCRGTVSDSFFTAASHDFSYCLWMFAGGTSAQTVWAGKGVYIGTTNIIMGVNLHSPSLGDIRKLAWVTSTEINQAGASANTWYHLALTFKTSDKSMKLYINAGTPVSGTAANQLTSSSSVWRIFDAGGGWGSSANSKIGLVYIYNKVLSATEVSQLYNSGVGV